MLTMFRHQITSSAMSIGQISSPYSREGRRSRSRSPISAAKLWAAGDHGQRDDEIVTWRSLSGHLGARNAEARYGRSKGQMRILVIDDEPRILGFLARGLEAEGFTVAAADTGPDALRCVRGDGYDLVRLLLPLPAVDCVSVLQELHPDYPNLPIIIGSAHS